MFWLFAVWVGVVLVVSAVISAVLVGEPFPGVWGRVSHAPRPPHDALHKPALAGRSP